VLPADRGQTQRHRSIARAGSTGPAGEVSARCYRSPVRCRSEKPAGEPNRARVKGSEDMNRAPGVPRQGVEVEQEQPLPWRAAEVYVSFNGGPALTCHATRCPGDLIRLDLDRPTVPVGTSTEIQWTQDGRGSYAAGTVVESTSTIAGLHIRVDESVSGIERRLGTRVSVNLAVTLTTDDGQVLHCRTEDLAMGGAYVSTTTPAAASVALTSSTQASVALALPDQTAFLRCLVVRTDPGATRIRLRFVDADAATLVRLGTFLHSEQRRTAKQQPTPNRT
jgi:PilZ domain